MRSTARLLVVVMLLASGRLLACGWECIDDLAAPAEASCHEDSNTDHGGLPTVALAKVGEAAHACLLDVAEPRVTVAKTAKAPTLAAAPLVPRFAASHWLVALSRDRLQPSRHRNQSPHSRAPFVLRI